jgi:hypothetical protein
MTPHRPWWVLAVILGYVLTVAATFLSPVILFHADPSGYLSWPVLTVLILWPLLLAGLLFVPVQVARRRPMTRRTIWVPLLTTGFLAGVLAFGGILALNELCFGANLKEWPFYCICVSGIGAWACWTGLFYLLTRTHGPTAVGLRIHRWLYAGSALELLIALPAHIIVRRRTECCAGFFTGFGIACGIVVALLAFGPSLALLFVHRWKRIANPIPPGRAFEVQMPQLPNTSPPGVTAAPGDARPRA